MGCSTICVLREAWLWYPGVGWYIGILGALGVAVTILRDLTKIGRGEKAAWITITTILLLLELHSIRLDRDAHDKEQHEARTAELLEFDRIAEKMDASLESSNENFAKTMKDIARSVKHTVKVEKDTGTLLGDVKAVRDEIHVLHKGQTSGNTLVAITSKLTDTMRDIRGTWGEAIHDLELVEDQDLLYRPPFATPLSAEQRTQLEQSYDVRKDRAITQMESAIKIAASSAEELREQLIPLLPKEGHTPEDDQQVELFKHLDIFSGYQGCCPEMERAADYLDSLAKRVKSALGD